MRLLVSLKSNLSIWMSQYPYFLAGEIKLTNPTGEGVIVAVQIAEQIHHADTVLF
jgi:hypothetical protein